MTVAAGLTWWTDTVPLGVISPWDGSWLDDVCALRPDSTEVAMPSAAVYARAQPLLCAVGDT